MSLSHSKKTRHARLVGKTLAGKYFIRNIVGVGGFGIVYEADDTAHARRVIIKIPKGRTGPTTLLRFRREARAGSILRHPNVCMFYDLGALDDDTPFLVMERLMGETLAARLTRERVLPLGVAVDVMCQALAGLGAAHDHGIIHRDMKPANIFITNPSNLGSRVKVLDFGISYFQDKPGEYEDEVTDLLTAIGTVVGTPHFMAPEQVLGERDFDARVDVFACGGIFFEMITGRRAFPGHDPHEIFDRILNVSPKPPSQTNADIPPIVDDIVAKALAVDRNARFSSAHTFANALQQLRTFVPTPIESFSPKEGRGSGSERQAYLKTRFRELVALRNNSVEPTPTARSRNSSTLDIPIHIDESAYPPVPNLIPSDDDPEGTAPTKPKRRQAQRTMDSTTEKVIPGSMRRPRKR